MATAYVALGANLGDRLGALSRAVGALGQLGTVEATSAVYETAPVGYVDQPPYLNAAVRIWTELPPAELVERLVAIDHAFGRVRSFPNAPRPIDLDLLFYDDHVSDDPAATVPHPRLHQRRFVLLPLADIAPNLLHPVLGQTVAELLARLPPEGGERLIAASIPPPGSAPAGGDRRG